MESHLGTGHRGVALTMTDVRERYWVPRLRQLVKKLRFHCVGCKRFQAKAFNKPPPGILPKERTEAVRPFQVVGVDYAGPIRYKAGKGKEGNHMFCYLHAVLPEHTVNQFMMCLKGFIARRGRPSKMYSDSAKTCGSVEEKLKVIIRNEKLNDYLARQDIQWTFNLSKAPWWGGQFERIIRLVKQAMQKIMGKAKLKLEDLKEVMLDTEATLNNRLLCYVEDDIQQPELTPNVMMLGSDNALLQEDIGAIADKGLKKGGGYLERCKETLWKRWSNEYVKALREGHNMRHQGKDAQISIGDVVLIKSDEKNRGLWSIRIVESLIIGKDGIVRGARLRPG